MSSRVFYVAFVLVAFGAPLRGHANGLDLLDERLARAFPPQSASLVSSGVLLDRVLPLARLDRFDGSAFAPAASPATIRQMVHELQRASFRATAAPSADELRARGQHLVDGASIPISVIDARVDRLRADAAEDGSLHADGERIAFDSADLEPVRVFAAAPLVEATRRGAEVSFTISAELWMSWNRPVPARISIDLDDGGGFRDARFGEPIVPAWRDEGPRVLQLRATWPDGETRVARFGFNVAGMQTPAPDDTLEVVASVPYGGTFGTGRAYVTLAPGHASITNPVVVIEGFDLDDTMSWERLYELLNEQNLLEDLRQLGYDAVVLDFTSATDPIQRNAFVVSALLEQVAASIDPAQDIFLVGASMGGLCARYALSYLESQLIDPRVRTFLSFDAPHTGANVPLGIQYWLDFFADQSTDAAFLLSRLDTPAARQMLVAHHTTPPGPTGVPDPLRGTLLSDLAALGDWPLAPRLAAVANGSGVQMNQGFEPAQQIIFWEYRSFLVDIDGNVWAVPDASNATIFHGRIDIILFPEEEQVVTVSGTPPWDNAPGGSRDSMFQMDTTAAPYGDIVALHDRHCFIPTVSALALDTPNLFFDVAGEPDLLALTPFDAVRWADINEEHVSISPETKAWILAEITADATGSPIVAGLSSTSPRLQLLGAFPNPSRTPVQVRFSLREDATVDADVYDVAGRHIESLLRGERAMAGTHSLPWKPSVAGTYFMRVRAASEEATAKIIAIE